MTVLLTRPQGSNQSLSNALKQEGITYAITPLMAIEACNITAVDIHNLAAADVVIFVSVNAVRFAAQANLDLSQLPNTVIAVGSATQQALNDIGITATTNASAKQHSEGLLELPELCQVKQQNIVIVRGVGGREVLADELRQRGAQVDYCEVYRRVLPADLDRKNVAQWQQEQVSLIVITSGEILANLIKLVPDSSTSWLWSRILVVPSQRVAELAKQAGFLHVNNAGSANTQAMLTTVLELIPRNLNGR